MRENTILHTINIGIATVVSIVTIGAFFYTIDDRWAKANDLKYIELRLDQKILSDRLYEIQKRIWELEDRYGAYDDMPDVVKEEYRKLKQEYELTKAQLDSIYNQVRKK